MTDLGLMHHWLRHLLYMAFSMRRNMYKCMHNTKPKIGYFNISIVCCQSISPKKSILTNIYLPEALVIRKKRLNLLSHNMKYS